MPLRDRSRAAGRRRARLSLSVRALLALVVITLTAGCGPEADQPAPVQGQAVATYTDPTVYRVGPSELRRIVGQLDPDSPQRAILADGHVSRPEVDGAWEDYVTCLRRAGFTVTSSAWDPVTNATRIFTYARSAAAAPTTPTTPRAAAPLSRPTTRPTTMPTTRPTLDSMTSREVDEVDACDETYWFPVSAVYAADTVQRMDPRLASAVVACLSAHGQPVQGATDFGAMVGAVRGQARGERVRVGRACLEQGLTNLYPDLPYFPSP